jgi:hypothetical protein
VKYFFWSIIIFVVGSFVACNGDRVISEHLFEKYCNEEGRTGQFIYERVSLDDEYFIPIPKDPRKVNFHFIVDDNFMMDKELLEKDYAFSKYSEVIPLSSIGPISSIETSVTRKSDNKVLGKSVSLSNRQGWLAQQSILGQSPSDSCPRGYDKSKGSHEDSLLHATLVKNIFYKK